MLQQPKSVLTLLLRCRVHMHSSVTFVCSARHSPNIAFKPALFRLRTANRARPGNKGHTNMLLSVKHLHTVPR